MTTGFEKAIPPGTKVIIRQNWGWNSGATGGGTWLATKGEVMEIGEVGLILAVGRKLFAFPFAGITHIELLDPDIVVGKEQADESVGIAKVYPGVPG